MPVGSPPPAYAPELYQTEHPYPVETPYPVANPYPASVTTTGPTPPRRRASYYILLSLAALALFAISMFVTVLVLA